MVKIRLKRIEIRNFKKLKRIDIDFNGDKSSIVGANGTPLLGQRPLEGLCGHQAHHSMNKMRLSTK